MSHETAKSAIAPKNTSEAPKLTSGQRLKLAEQAIKDAQFHLASGKIEPAKTALLTYTNWDITLPTPPTVDPMSGLPIIEGLRGLVIDVAIGHTRRKPGTQGKTQSGSVIHERQYAKDQAQRMQLIARHNGALVRVHEHTLSKYTDRQKALGRKIRAQPSLSDLTLELHIDAYYTDRSKAGHHFKYRGASRLARHMNRQFIEDFPSSLPRYSKGLHHCRHGNGAGFLLHTPSWAILCEPFMVSNLQQATMFDQLRQETAESYMRGIAKWNLSGREKKKV